MGKSRIQVILAPFPISCCTQQVSYFPRKVGSDLGHADGDEAAGAGATMAVLLSEFRLRLRRDFEGIRVAGGHAGVEEAAAETRRRLVKAMAAVAEEELWRRENEEEQERRSTKR